MAVAAVLVASTQSAIAAPPDKFGLGWSLAPVQKDKSVPVHAVRGRGLPEDLTAKAAAASLPTPVWPSAGDYETRRQFDVPAGWLGVAGRSPVRVVSTCGTAGTNWLTPG
jgi:hypothetical protein